MLSMTIDREIENQLEALGAETESSKIALVRETLQAALAEDLHDIQMARERLASPARRWSQEELERGIDLES